MLNPNYDYNVEKNQNYHIRKEIYLKYDNYQIIVIFEFH